jgi:hypothetical protein
LLNLATGSGIAVLARYYFDAASATCKAFTYTGIGGNEVKRTDEFIYKQIHYRITFWLSPTADVHVMVVNVVHVSC